MASDLNHLTRPRAGFSLSGPRAGPFLWALEMKPRVELVRGWRTWWRQWSTWLAASGAAVLNFAPELAEALTHAWNLTPLDIKATFDPETVRWLGFAITVLSIPAKLIRQRKLAIEAENERRGVEAH